MHVSARDKAREAIQQSLVPGDLVAGIIASSGVRQIPASELTLASIFYSLSRKEPDLFVEFDFSPSTTFPFSDVLQDNLGYFETEHFIGKPNPTYRFLELKDDQAFKTWTQRWVFSKLERHGVLERVQELGRLFKESVDTIEQVTQAEHAVSELEDSQ